MRLLSGRHPGVHRLSTAAGESQRGHIDVRDTLHAIAKTAHGLTSRSRSRFADRHGFDSPAMSCFLPDAREFQAILQSMRAQITTVLRRRAMICCYSAS